MKKVAVIYWSQTGNTQQMAQLIAQGALEGGERRWNACRYPP